MDNQNTMLPHDQLHQTAMEALKKLQNEINLFNLERHYITAKFSFDQSIHHRYRYQWLMADDQLLVAKLALNNLSTSITAILQGEQP